MADSASTETVSFASLEASSQAASASFIQHIRQTLQKAQEITQAVSEAESIAEDATKFCDAIKAQHNIQSKKLALTGKPSAPVPPLAASLTREIQTSVVWTQSMLQMCNMAESSAEIARGSQLKFIQKAGAPTVQ
eukprot:TRINITY_DN92485_c0_g1_i1.p1 TRINITY_DN92485_c0_g1~~TRINITY_DN92485_c0_g1_i1.p1  ORF type:complete len:154 (+),score=46.43 TRINITY_DN92485_c0_g1_i1:58-462(+)